MPTRAQAGVPRPTRGIVPMSGPQIACGDATKSPEGPPMTKISTRVAVAAWLRL